MAYGPAESVDATFDRFDMVDGDDCRRQPSNGTSRAVRYSSWPIETILG